MVLRIIIGLLMLGSISLKAANDIVVAKDGSGDFKTLTEAIASLPYYNYERIVIYLKNGVYNEKIKIRCDYITIKGESRDSTVIQYAQLREDWQENKDDIGPAVINIEADDIVLDNLTIKNTQPRIGPHAFTVLGNGTRTIIVNCNVTSKGGDTVSLWDYKTGMYYHDNCYFEGAVDFVCPRGWCYISNSTFKELKNTAAIWHAAPTNPNQKFVLRNCDFLGVDSFYLARHHYDAQFYLLNCRFSSYMRDKSIQHVTYPDKPYKNRPYIYGDRYYFYNCSREGGNYKWFANNLDSISLHPDRITPEWTFDRLWDPMDTSKLNIKKVEYQQDLLCLWFDEIVMPEGEFKVISKTGILYSYISGSGSKCLKLVAENTVKKAEEYSCLQVYSGNVKNIIATVEPRYLK